MQMISSGRANIVPPLLMAACFALIVARFGFIVYDAFVTPPPVNLVDWQKPVAFNEDYPGLLEKPGLYYFVDSKNVLDNFKCQLFESTVLKNREVARAMRERFRCIKVDLGQKDDKAAQSVAKSLAVEAAPEIMIALPNGKVVSTSTLQITDRLFVSSLNDAFLRTYKVAGDTAMARANFKDAINCYKKYLETPGITDESRLAVLVRYYIALRSLGQNNEAKVVLDKYSKAGDYQPIDCVKLFKGELPVDKFNNRMGKFNPTSAHYVLGMKYLFDGNKAAAIESLQWAARRGSLNSPDTMIAAGQLKKLGEIVPSRAEDEEEAKSDSRYEPIYE